MEKTPSRKPDGFTETPIPSQRVGQLSVMFHRCRWAIFLNVYSHNCGHGFSGVSEAPVCEIVDYVVSSISPWNPTSFRYSFKGVGAIDLHSGVSARPGYQNKWLSHKNHIRGRCNIAVRDKAVLVFYGSSTHPPEYHKSEKWSSALLSLHLCLHCPSFLMVCLIFKIVGYIMLTRCIQPLWPSALSARMAVTP